MEDILNKLTGYTLALRDALERTNESSERPVISRHLAAAAEMYALLHMHKTSEAIAHIVKAENRIHGWSTLSGDNGQRVAKKWLEFIEAAGVEL
ncbi:MAG TPA: hypothetical protein DEG76_12005 [Pseudohongiella sp.]|nr:hypothetical protein [Pseudohongiella sp.]HBX37962.1 hypothetical protein [Pseudohongiella sp.]|tara:strand:- start:20775 stop:21056 length:282 start_codon:yes stop_codon:yes gene_type:complete